MMTIMLLGSFKVATFDTNQKPLCDVTSYV